MPPTLTARVLKRRLRDCRVTRGAGFRLDRHDTAAGHGAETARELLERNHARLQDWQARLYAERRHALLLIFQGMDAAGKDGVIRHVMAGINPQGCEVTSFKAPSQTELAHDFLWRACNRLPERGQVAIFNRSYYEEVLVVRVHPELLEAQRLPPARGKQSAIWKERLEDIAAFERHLARAGTRVLKFFLHVSREEQRKRLLARLDEPAKNWKFSPADLGERAHWTSYLGAYERAIRATARPHAPWYVIPADHKWYARLLVSAAVTAELAALGPDFPRPDAFQRRALSAARRALGGRNRPAARP